MFRTFDQIVMYIGTPAMGGRRLQQRRGGCVIMLWRNGGQFRMKRKSA
jgi:hypothetical protein